MSIDFSQVKTITIPEGSVTKITDSNGNILWQGQSGEWHTIWEGNKTITVTKSGTNKPVISGNEANFAQTVAGTGTSPKIRITFSYSNTNTDYDNWKTEFNINQSRQTTMSSPVTIEAVKYISSFFSTNLCLVLCKTTVDGAVLGAGLKSKFDKSNNKLNISLASHNSGDLSLNGDFTLTFTVTKIEQYY